jgi:hypothetical protein
MLRPGVGTVELDGAWLSLRATQEQVRSWKYTNANGIGTDAFDNQGTMPASVSPYKIFLGTAAVVTLLLDRHRRGSSIGARTADQTIGRGLDGNQRPHRRAARGATDALAGKLTVFLAESRCVLTIARRFHRWRRTRPGRR